MTREEFKDWANDAWACCTMNEGEQFVLGLRRATLQEAARAVCPDCRNEVALEAFKKNEKTYWSHQSEKGDTARCDAGPIHGLIAALDKEGGHE